MVSIAVESGDDPSMPTAAVYAAGGTAYMPANNPSSHVRAKRAEIVGWSPGAVRRQRNWLYSVDVGGLSGTGYALTLTMRHTPPTPDDLSRALRALLDRFRRLGRTRLHWVIEWQARGVPHLHMAVYFAQPLPLAGYELVGHWMELAEPWGVRFAAQDVKPIEASDGWLKYLGKHASRGVRHYQRSSIPQSWTKTGRLWGHAGEWPTDEPMRFDIDRAGWYRYRRLLRAWRIADARKDPNPKTRAQRLRHARRMLSCADPKLSAVRGVSEWTPEPLQVALLDLLARDGHLVQQVG